MDKFARFHLLMIASCILLINLRLNMAMDKASKEIINDDKMKEMFKQIAVLTGNEEDWKEVDEGKQQQQLENSAPIHEQADKSVHASQQQKHGKLVIFSNTSARTSNSMKGIKNDKNDENCKKDKTNKHIHLIGNEMAGDEKYGKQVDNLVEESESSQQEVAKNVVALQKKGCSIGELKSNEVNSPRIGKGKPLKPNEPNNEEVARMNAERRQIWLEKEKMRKLRRKQQWQNDVAIDSQSGMKGSKPSDDSANNNLVDVSIIEVPKGHLQVEKEVALQEGSREDLKQPGPSPVENENLVSHEEIRPKKGDINRSPLSSRNEASESHMGKSTAERPDQDDNVPTTLASYTRKEDGIAQINLLLDALQSLNEAFSDESKLPGDYAKLLFGQKEDDELNLIYWRINLFLLTKAIRKKWEEFLSAEVTARKPAAKGQSSSGKRRGRNQKGKKLTMSMDMAAPNEVTHEQLEKLRKLADELLSTYDFKAKMVIKQGIVERIAEFWVILNGNNREKLVISEEGQHGEQETSVKANKLLWAEVHSLNLEAMKKLLLGKDVHGNANELTKAFLFLKMGNDSLCIAKARMYQMFGDRMFTELELQAPVLLRPDIIDVGKFLQLHKQIFSAPIQLNEYNEPLVELQISFVFGGILYLANRKYKNADRISKELQSYWDKNVATLCAGGKGVSSDSLEKVLKKFKKWYKMLAEQTDMKIEEMIRIEHGDTLNTLYKSEDSLLRQFMKETPGVRARVHKFLAPDTPDALLHFDLDESAMLDQMATNYYNSVESGATKSKLRRTAQMNSKLLVQMHWLDAHFLSTETNKQLWNSFRDMFLLFLDQFVDADPQHVQLYGSFYNNHLFLIIQNIEDNDHEGIQRNFEQLARIKQMVKRNIFTVYEDKSLFAEKQAQWLPREHWKLLKQMFVQAVVDSSEAVKRLHDMSPEKVKQLAELLTGKNAHQSEMKPEAFVELFKKKTLMEVGDERASNNSEKRVLEEDVEEEEEFKQEVKQQFNKSKGEESAKETVQKVVIEVGDVSSRNSAERMTEEGSRILVKSYLRLLAETSSELDRLRAHTAVDIIVQLHWLGNKFTQERMNRSSIDVELVPKSRLSSMRDQGHAGLEFAQWILCREKLIVFLNQMEENDREFVHNYSILFNNLLFKLIKGENTLRDFLKNLKSLVTYKEAELNGERSRISALPLNVEPRAKWMANEHLATLKRLRAEGLIRDLNQRELDCLATFLNINKNENKEEFATLGEIFGNGKKPEEVGKK